MKQVTNSRLVLSTLSTSGPMCDDCMAAFAKITPRQTVNAECRLLAKQGAFERKKAACPRCHRDKIVNSLIGASLSAVSPIFSESVESPDQIAGRPWYWEGHVQDSLIVWLKASGWTISKSANTASREAGTDIVAKRNDEQLWVSVKGWPEKSVHTQARHWFAGVIFDLVRYRDLDASATLAIGIPAGFTTYRNLIKSVKWLRYELPFSVFEVGELGTVNVVLPSSPASAL